MLKTKNSVQRRIGRAGFRLLHVLILLALLPSSVGVPPRPAAAAYRKGALADGVAEQSTGVSNDGEHAGTAGQSEPQQSILPLPQNQPAAVEDPTPNPGHVVYVATRAHLARSFNFYQPDETTHWQNVKGDLPVSDAPATGLGILDFAYDPFDPSERAWVVVKGNEFTGLWRTDNLSAPSPSWEKVLDTITIVSSITPPPPPNSNYQQCSPDPSMAWLKRVKASSVTPNLIYILAAVDCLYGNHKLYTYVGKSIDGGQNWSWSDNLGIGWGRVQGLELSVHEADRVWVGVNDANGNRYVYKYVATTGGKLVFDKLSSTTDTGLGDSTIYPPYDIHIPLTSNDSTIFAVAGGNSDLDIRLYRYTDGSGWVNVTAVGESFPYDPVRSNAYVAGSDLANDQAVFYSSLSYGNGTDQRFLQASDGGISPTSWSASGLPYQSVVASGWDGRLLAARLNDIASPTSNGAIAISEDNGVSWVSKVGDWAYVKDPLTDVRNIAQNYKGGAGGGSVIIVDAALLIQDRSVNDASTVICPKTYSDATSFVVGPINPRTGGYDYSVEDLSIPTSAGPLAFRRTYSTQAVSLDTALLSPGWTHSLDTRLIFPEDPGGLGGWVLFKADSTNRYQFRIDSNNTYVPYPGLCASLVKSGAEYVLTDASENVYRFRGDSPGKGRLTQYSDPQGHSLHYNYDTYGRLDKVMDDVENITLDPGRYITLTYETAPSTRLLSVHDHTGRGITFSYSGDLLSSVVDVMNKTWTYHYDDQVYPNFLTAVEDPLGNVVEATAFDAKGRAVRQYEGGAYSQLNYNGLNPAATLSYSPGVTTVTERGVTTTYKYDRRNTLVQKSNTSGAMNKVYDANFRPTEVRMPASEGGENVTTMLWSANGFNLKQITQGGYTISMNYNDLNLMTSKTDGRNYTTSYTYNGTLLESSTDALANPTTYEYTDSGVTGLLKKVTNPEGESTSYTYTPFGQKETVTDAAGLVTTYHYNLLGLVSRVETPQGRKEWTCYDNAGRAVRSLRTYSAHPMPEASACDLNPSVPLAYAERLHETKYDDAGRAVASIEWRLENGAPVSRATRTFYDDHGRAQYIVQNASDLQASIETLRANSTNEQNLIRETVYDQNGRVIATIDPLGIATRSYYDSLGRPEFVLRNFVSENISDPQPYPGQLYGDQNVTSQTMYDAAGNAVASNDWWMEGEQAKYRITRFYFDALNRPVTVVQNLSDQDIGNPVPPERDLGQTGPDTVNVRTDTHYDANGNVIATVDALGITTRTFYDPLNRPTLVVRNLTSQHYSVESEPLESTFGNTENVASRTAYDDAGRAIATTVWWRTADNVLKKRTTRTFYDEFGRVQYVVQNASDLQAGIETLRASKTNEQNLISETRYDDYGRAFATIDPLDRAVRTYYDDHGRTKYVVRNCTDLDANHLEPPAYSPATYDQNVRTETIYDSAGRVIATRDALGHTTRTYFDALDRSIRVVRNFANSDLYAPLPAYDPQHPDLYVRSETDYNAAGQVVAARDAPSAGSGQALGRETRTVYDDLGRPTGMVRNYVACNLQNLSACYDPANPDQDFVTQTAYDSFGRTIAVIDAQGRITRTYYDKLGRSYAVVQNLLVSAEHPFPDSAPPVYTTTVTAYNLRSDTIYDQNGRGVETIDANGVKTCFEYDNLGRATAVVENCQPGAAADAETNVRTEYTFDALGNRLSIKDGKATLGGTNDKTTFVYDALGRLTGQTDPLDRTISFSYDAGGRKTGQSDLRPAAIGYQYDLLNNLTLINYPDPENDVTLGYNGLGWRTTMNDGLGAAAWEYDGVGRLLTATLPLAGAVGVGYDGMGNRVRLQYPDGRRATMVYDGLNRLTRVTDWDDQDTDYTYHQDGQLANVTLPNGVVSHYGYDPAGRLGSVSHRKEWQYLGGYGYSLDAVGNRVGAEETYTTEYQFMPLVPKQPGGGNLLNTPDGPGDPYPAPDPYPDPEGGSSLLPQEFLDWLIDLLSLGATPAEASLGGPPLQFDDPLQNVVIVYQYDALRRLKQADYDDGTHFNYTYDSNGNVLSYTRLRYGVSETTTYTFDAANQLETAHSGTDPITWHYHFDALGSLEQVLPNDAEGDGARHYSYDAAARLVQVETHDGAAYQTQAQMAYNGVGQRMTMTATSSGLSVTTTYTPDPTARSRMLAATANGQTSLYLYGLGPLGEFTNAWSYSLPDATGTPRQLTDAGGLVTLANRYDPWGEILQQAGQGNFTWGYFGGLMDAATGLIYVGEGQYYDPRTGRFLSRGAQPGKANPYVPWGGDPTGFLMGPLALMVLWRWKKRDRQLGRMERVLLVALVLAAVGVALAGCNIPTPGPSPTPSPSPVRKPPPQVFITPGPTDAPITPSATQSSLGTPEPTTCPEAPTSMPTPTDDEYRITLDDVPKADQMEPYLMNESDSLLLARIAIGEGAEGNKKDQEYVMWTVKIRAAIGFTEYDPGDYLTGPLPATDIKSIIFQDRYDEKTQETYKQYEVLRNSDRSGVLDIPIDAMAGECSLNTRRMINPCDEKDLQALKDAHLEAQRIINQSIADAPQELRGYESYTAYGGGAYCGWGDTDTSLIRRSANLAGGNTFFDCVLADDFLFNSISGTPTSTP